MLDSLRSMTEQNISLEYFVMEGVHYKTKTNEEILLKSAVVQGTNSVQTT
jgi:hypothetical protein